MYAGKVALRDVKDGTATLPDLAKLNALMDLEAAQANAIQAKARRD